MICTFLSAPFFTRAQGVEEADSLFRAAQFLAARVGYERLLFEGQGNANDLLLKKSYCLKAEGKYEQALQTLERADFFESRDSVRFLLYYEAALDAYLSHRHDVALSRLQELNHYLPGLHSPLADVLEVLSLNHLQKWDQAETKFHELQKRYGVNEASPYGIRKITRMKDPDKAETLSFLFPGSGQLYAGHWGRGITSLLIQGGLVAFATYSFINGFYFSGAFTGVGLFYLFYNGGARHARFLAEKRNTQRIARLNEAVLHQTSPLTKK